LIPSTVWASSFGTDRAQLIGHKLDPAKLRSKIPSNLATLDLHLSLLEPTFKKPGAWCIPTKTPSLADISLYYQLRWGIDIAAGVGIENLSGGGAKEGDGGEDVGKVFNKDRYPGLWAWFHAFETYIASLPDLQASAPASWISDLRATPLLSEDELLVHAAVEQHPSLDAARGLVPGVSVSIAPDDTGRDNPTVGTLVRIGVEEVVIRPNEKAEVGVRVHFPRLGFVVRVVEESRL
jgi:hypothetical protein